jgi:hypothetical protein
MQVYAKEAFVQPNPGKCIVSVLKDTECAQAGGQETMQGVANSRPKHY